MKKYFYLLIFAISISFTSCILVNDPYNPNSSIIVNPSRPGYQHVSGKVFDKRTEYVAGYAYYYLYIIDQYNCTYHVQVSFDVWYNTNIGDYVSF